MALVARAACADVPPAQAAQTAPADTVSATQAPTPMSQVVQERDKAAMTKRRDSSMERLLAGEKDVKLFYEVAALSEELGERDISYRLFLTLRERDSDFAKRCGKNVRPSLLAVHDYKLARATIADPYGEVLDDVRTLNLAPAMLTLANAQNANPNGQDARAAMLSGMNMALTNAFIEEIKQMLRIMHGANPREDTAHLVTFALDHIQDQGTRATVRQALQGYQPAP